MQQTRIIQVHPDEDPQPTLDAARADGWDIYSGPLELLNGNLGYWARREA